MPGVTENTTKLPTSVRIDKFLWAVRIFSSRGEATEACRSGHVKILGVAVKPAREVKTGETIEVRARDMTKTLRVIQLLEKRVGAKIVPEHIEDKTPAEEVLRALERSHAAARPAGAGRPTKRERRVLDQLWGGPAE